MVSDKVAADVYVVYSGIAEEWCAELVDPGGETLEFARASTRVEALRGLADAIEGTPADAFDDSE